MKFGISIDSTQFFQIIFWWLIVQFVTLACQGILGHEFQFFEFAYFFNNGPFLARLLLLITIPKYLFPCESYDIWASRIKRLGEVLKPKLLITNKRNE